MIAMPAASEFAPFYAGYVAKVPEADALPALEQQLEEVQALCAGVPPARERFRYAPGKWSVREILGHLIDAERVFGFRLFCFARGDANPLPPFDENVYIARSDYDTVPLAGLAAEWAAARTLNLLAIRRLRPEQLLLQGTASGAMVSVRARARILVGHVRHHVAVRGERYAVGTGSRASGRPPGST